MNFFQKKEDGKQEEHRVCWERVHENRGSVQPGHAKKYSAFFVYFAENLFDF